MRIMLHLETKWFEFAFRIGYTPINKFMLYHCGSWHYLYVGPLSIALTGKETENVY